MGKTNTCKKRILLATNKLAVIEDQIDFRSYAGRSVIVFRGFSFKQCPNEKYDIALYENRSDLNLEEPFYKIPVSEAGSIADAFQRTAVNFVESGAQRSLIGLPKRRELALFEINPQELSGESQLGVYSPTYQHITLGEIESNFGRGERDRIQELIIQAASPF
ncbi:MAG: hypothetical protein KJ600_03975 [Nanoarchaeota archaeon]|nr:hypothetical protein [Nanoarchaeota archaeon]MBU1103685.1 hypothetical protein [Nanoarchaeota archaeon]